MTGLNIFYCILGAVFLLLGAGCLIEKYRTVRGGTLVTARILRCEKGKSVQNPAAGSAHRAGGYHYVVGFTTPDGQPHTAVTNDSFWADHSGRVDTLCEVWYNPASPKVERKSPEAEILCAVCAALGVGIILWLGLG